MEFVRPNNKHCGAIRRRFTMEFRRRIDEMKLRVRENNGLRSIERRYASCGDLMRAFA
jgi:hypothetical protein